MSHILARRRGYKDVKYSDRRVEISELKKSDRSQEEKWEMLTKNETMPADEHLLDGEIFQLNVDSYYYDFLTYSDTSCTCNSGQVLPEVNEQPLGG